VNSFKLAGGHVCSPFTLSKTHKSCRKSTFDQLILVWNLSCHFGKTASITSRHLFFTKNKKQVENRHVPPICSLYAYHETSFVVIAVPLFPYLIPSRHCWHPGGGVERCCYGCCALLVSWSVLLLSFPPFMSSVSPRKRNNYCKYYCTVSSYS